MAPGLAQALGVLPVLHQSLSLFTHLISAL